MEALKNRVWEIVEPVVSGAGFQLFDIEVPTGPSGILRLYVWKGKGVPVLLDDCADVSRLFDENTALDEAIPGEYVLEVSSPGINRKLTRREHFESAVGERIKIVFEGIDGRSRSLKGTITSLSGDTLKVFDKDEEEDVDIELSRVKRAAVDFNFSAG